MLEKIESLLNTHVYFTHPYHSWEKGLVENTNRWIRCFVPKRRDIMSVSDEEIKEILSFINDRPERLLDTKCQVCIIMRCLVFYLGVWRP